MLKTMICLSVADLKTCLNLDVYEAILAGKYFSSSLEYSGHIAFCQQVACYHDGTSFDKRHDLHCRLPVNVMHGLQDSTTPRQILEENQIEYDWVDFRIYPDAGHWLVFDHWQNALDLAKTHLD